MVCDPLVLESSRRVEPCFGVGHEKLLHEIDGWLAHGAPAILSDDIVGFVDGLDLHLLRATERHVAHKEDEDNHAKGPEVALRSVIALENFRSHVCQRAA